MALPAVKKKTIWIDLDNTPHVPFFIPIKKEMEKRGFRVLLTARDAFQVCELAQRKGLLFETIGHHYGKNKVMKVYGWIWRALSLSPWVWRHKPDLALCHGSRSQVLIANLWGIPTVEIIDYEHSRDVPFARPDWVVAPEVIASAKLVGKKALRYPGLKEDVYVQDFVPDPGILTELSLSDQDFIVTVRPPATEAHYHNPESEKIFSAIIEWILSTSKAKIILLPRNKKQGLAIQKNNVSWFTSKRVTIPNQAVDGLNLIYFSDVVISGGGTMNREAGALGVPVYSIFRGPLGDVDRHLEADGRLIMISAPEEIPTKLKLVKRIKPLRFEGGPRPALSRILDHLETILKEEADGQDC